MAHQLQCAIGDHLIGVHVRGGAGAALKDIELKLVVQLAVDELPTRALDARQNLLAELTAVEVGARGRHLHHAQAFDQIGIERELDTGDVKILEGARGLDAVVGVGWHGLVAQQIVFQASSGS